MNWLYNKHLFIDLISIINKKHHESTVFKRVLSLSASHTKSLQHNGHKNELSIQKNLIKDVFISFTHTHEGKS